MNALKLKACLWLVFMALAMGLLLFLTAGTVRYWQAWVYLAVYFGPALAITLHLAENDPALLERRLRAGPSAETRRPQKIIMRCTIIGFIALLVVPALDYRFQWSSLPLVMVLGGDLLTLAGIHSVFLVYKENPFARATIEVEAGQTVISTGPYAVVRHPLYAGALQYLLGMPLALGSSWGLLALAAMAPFLIWRLLDEERVLRESLPGYPEYCAKVRWRLFPGIF